MGLLAKIFGHAPEKPPAPASTIPLLLHNTMSGKEEVFAPKGTYVRMYNCGPTVYGEQHVGNLSMFVFTDVLRRVLEFNGFPVKQVINITDVGHLVSDADDGEDKMTKGLKREGLTLTLENMKVMAEKYTATFIGDLGKLGVDTSRISFPRATDHIHGQIALIKTLDEKGYVYKTKDGLYFDTALFKDYGKLGNIKLDALKEGARVEENREKRHPADFALWKFNAALGWETPWGKGFPGWHIECSAMSRSELGEQLDIHTGGIEHISVHHNNEIAQSEAATGKRPFARFWLHRAHLQMGGHKISKSEGNVVYLSDIIDKGFHPLAFRYLLLTSHYRSPSNFTWEALAAAQTTLIKLHRTYREHSKETALVAPALLRSFHERINADLDTPGAIAFIWETIKTKRSPGELKTLLEAADRVLGLSLVAPDAGLVGLIEKGGTLADDELPENVRELLKKRAAARTAKDWAASDTLRDELAALGFSIKDAGAEQEVSKK